MVMKELVIELISHKLLYLFFLLVPMWRYHYKAMDSSFPQAIHVSLLQIRNILMSYLIFGCHVMWCGDVSVLPILTNSNLKINYCNHKNNSKTFWFKALVQHSARGLSLTTTFYRVQSTLQWKGTLTNHCRVTLIGDAWQPLYTGGGRKRMN